MSPGTVLLIVDAMLDAAVSYLPDAAARPESVQPILVRAAGRAGALHRETHSGAARGEAIAQVLARVGKLAAGGQGSHHGPG